MSFQPGLCRVYIHIMQLPFGYSGLYFCRLSWHRDCTFLVFFIYHKSGILNLIHSVVTTALLTGRNGYLVLPGLA